MKNPSLSVLNGLLLHEISAVKTYKNARTRLKVCDIGNELEALQNAHSLRVVILQDRIARLGGSTATVAGAWGIFNRSDAVAGEQSAICVFDDGETRTLESYVCAIDQLDEESRDIITMQLLPEQEASQSVVSAWREAIPQFGDNVVPAELAS